MSELTTSPTAATAAPPRRAGRFGRLLASISLLRESPIGMIGAFLVLFWVTLAVLAPVLPLFDPLAQSPGFLLKPILTPAKDGGTYWLGTDEHGRDMLSRLICGSRLVLFWSTLATVVAYAVGMLMGVVAGYRGGWWDEIISFFGNVLARRSRRWCSISSSSRSFGPASQFGQYLSHDLGLDPVLTAGVIIILAVTFGTAPQVARIVRGLVLDLKTRDYIAAAEVRGESPCYIMLVELLAQCARPAHRRCLPAARLCHDHHRAPRLLSAWPAAARSRLGQDDFGRPEIRLDRQECDAVAGRCHLLAGARPQSAGRRHARNFAQGLRPCRKTPHRSRRSRSSNAATSRISYYTRAGEVPAVSTST